MGGVTDAERLARALLTRLAEPGDTAIGRRVHEVGPEAVVGELRDGTSPLRRAEDYRPRLRAADPALDLGRLADLGGYFVVPGDIGWPRQLDDLGHASPLGLWCRGAADLRLASLRSVAVVGSRAATRYGERVAAELGAALAERGWTVVSGGAYGIDAASHRGALAVAGGVTVAAVAGGIDVSYPRGHDQLFARVVESGILVAEVPPGCAPTRLRFLVRNRLIAALSRGTVVVEAAARSGALSTAGHAARLNRVVMGVPGPVTSAASQGVHDLLRREALLVTGVDDVVAAVGPLSAPAGRGLRDPADSLDDDSRRVLDSLPVRRGAPVDRLAVTAGLAALRVAAVLGRLELAGLASCGPDGWRRAGPGP